MKQIHTWLLIALAAGALLLAACGGGSSASDTDDGVNVANTLSGGGGLAIDESQQSVDANGIPVGVTADGYPYWGHPEAPVVIEEYSDFQCPFCARHQTQTMPTIYREQIETGQVVYIFKDFTPTFVNPSYHSQAIIAGMAAKCAPEQGAFWPMHDLLFARQGAWGNGGVVEIVTSYANEIGLDMNGFGECLSTSRYEQQLRTSYEEGQRRGVTGTPAFFVNGGYLSGAQPISVFNQYIAAAQTGDLPVATNDQPPAPQQPAAAPTPATIGRDAYAFAMGDPNAPVTLVEFTDYQCPFCARHALETGPSINQEMIDSGRVYYMLKDMPLDSLHNEAREAAAAARCAGDQGAYWEMHETLFSRQDDWSGQGDEFALSAFAGYAAELGLETTAFSACLADGTHDAAVQANVDEGASLGVTGTPYFFVDGYPLNGARPFDTFALAVQYAEQGTLAEAYAPTEPQQQPQAPPTPSGPVTVNIEGAASLGDPNAPIVIVEFSDFQCPFCARHFTQTMPDLLRNYVETGQVRYVFKHFTPTLVNASYHGQAIMAAMASECAKEQGAFWEMHDMLFARQGEWGNDGAAGLFDGYAAELGLDTASFSECVATGRYEDVIRSDFDEGRSLGVTGTPNFFINGNLLSGAQPYSVFEQALASFANAGPLEN